MTTNPTALSPAPPPAAHSGDGVTRCVRSLRHGGLDVVVTATRRVTGVMVVVTEVHGGPDRLKRQFYTLSPLPDAAEAAAAALASIARMLDEGEPPARPPAVAAQGSRRRPLRTGRLAKD